MSGVQGQVFGHLVRRGYNAAQEHFSGPNPEYIQKLQHDAELYESAGPEMEMKPWEVVPILITAVLAMFVYASLKYTLGNVMTSLAMIETRTATAIIDDKPPAYTDEPDAPLSKDSLLPVDTDVEVTLVKNTLVTAKIRTTLAHLKHVGGFRAKWRGLGSAIVYHFLHAIVTNFWAGLLGMGMFGHSLVYIFSSVALARVHMAWTHAMIAQPSSKCIWKRMVPRKQCKALLLPSLVFAVAQQLCMILPILVAFAVGLPEMSLEHVQTGEKHCVSLVLLGLRILAVPATLLFVAFAVLLPATVTLVRIEALLLPETEETIVPFDRMAIMGDIDMNARGSARKLFVNAWRSFDRAARWRLIKLYAKIALVEVMVVLTAIHVMLVEMFFLGGDRLALLIKSANAQVQLASLEATPEIDT